MSEICYEVVNYFSNHLREPLLESRPKLNDVFPIYLEKGPC